MLPGFLLVVLFMLFRIFMRKLLCSVRGNVAFIYLTIDFALDRNLFVIGLSYGVDCSVFFSWYDFCVWMSGLT